MPATSLLSLFAIVVLGAFVTNLIEDAITRNSAATTALYVDSVIERLLRDMPTTEVLDDAVAHAHLRKGSVAGSFLDPGS